MKKLILVIFAALSLSGCANPTSPTTTPSTPSTSDSSYSSTPAAHVATITYKVTGTALAADLTIEAAGGGVAQFSGVSLPWSTSFNVTQGNHTFLYVAAQNTGSTGTVTAAILIDGTTFQTVTSSGAYVIATADGSY